MHAVGRYIASFLVVVILQAVWSEAQHIEDEKQQPQQQQNVRGLCRSAFFSFFVLVIAVALQFIAPRLDAFLLRQPDDVRPASLVAPPCEPRWAWKTVTGFFVTSVVLGLGIAATVLSGISIPCAVGSVSDTEPWQTLDLYQGLRRRSKLFLEVWRARLTSYTRD